MCAEQKHSCEDDSVCINRAIYVECTRKCPNGDKCKNQRIARREYAKTAVVLVSGRRGSEGAGTMLCDFVSVLQTQRLPFALLLLTPAVPHRLCLCPLLCRPSLAVGV